VAFGGSFREAKKRLQLDDAIDGDMTESRGLRADVRYILERWTWRAGGYVTEVYGTYSPGDKPQRPDATIAFDDREDIKARRKRWREFMAARQEAGRLPEGWAEPSEAEKKRRTYTKGEQLEMPGE
jgi:hypothetical protein